MHFITPKYILHLPLHILCPKRLIPADWLSCLLVSGWVPSLANRQESAGKSIFCSLPASVHLCSSYVSLTRAATWRPLVVQALTGLLTVIPPLVFNSRGDKGFPLLLFSGCLNHTLFILNLPLPL